MPELTRPARRPSRPWRLRRPLPYWGAAIALAMLTALLVGQLAAGASAARRRWSPGDPVVVLRRSLPAGAAVEPDDVERRRLPAAAVPVGALRSLPTGARAVIPLHRGEVVLADRVSGASGVTARLPAGTRGIAVPIDIGLPLRIGDRVDVLATFDAQVAGDAPTFAVATGAVIVHVGKDSVTVAVRESAAAKVAYALTAGAVTLVLSGTS
jgi:Flp pilus assembly protein CpaB